MTLSLFSQFKALCRALGIRRWPRRELQTLRSRVADARLRAEGREANDAAQSQAAWETYARRVSEGFRAAAHTSCADTAGGGGNACSRGGL